MERKRGLFMMKNKSVKFLVELVNRYNELDSIFPSILNATDELCQAFKNGNKLLCCGNGGSAADCEHLVGELMKGFILPRSISNELKAKLNDDVLSDSLQYGLPAISLISQTGLSTAFINDQLPTAVFAQQVLGYGKSGDILLCISTSGNSLNCVYAAKVAKALDLKVISLTGEKDSKLSTLSDITIKVPAKETFKIQEYHLPIYHAICLALENEFFGD